MIRKLSTYFEAFWFGWYFRLKIVLDLKEKNWPYFRINDVEKLLDASWNLNCMPQWRGETRAKTSRGEIMQSAWARLKITAPRYAVLTWWIISITFFFFFHWKTTSHKRGTSAVENLGSPRHWARQYLFDAEKKIGFFRASEVGTRSSCGAYAVNGMELFRLNDGKLSMVSKLADL